MGFFFHLDLYENETTTEKKGERELIKSTKGPFTPSESENIRETRQHSSRMRTTCFGGH